MSRHTKSIFSSDVSHNPYCLAGCETHRATFAYARRLEPEDAYRGGKY